MIGFVVSVTRGVLHGIGLLSFERPIASLISHVRRIDNRRWPSNWQYFAILILALGVACADGDEQARGCGLPGWPGGSFLESLLLVWICALYHVLFQPFPSLLRSRSPLLPPSATIFLITPGRSTLARAFFAERLSSDHVQRVIEGDMHARL